MKFIYDLETYKDAFIAVFKNIKTKEIHTFELSDRKNQIAQLYEFLFNVSGLIGFNNLSFDWPVLRYVLTKEKVTSEEIYTKANDVINQEYSILPKNLTEIKQLDLYKIWHFDNKAKATSLKWCEFFLRWPNLIDLPYKVDQLLTSEMIDEIIEYCINDVNATEKLFEISKEKIELRKILGKQYNLDLTNANDPKIGSEIFLSIISKHKGIDPLVLSKLRTYRPIISIKDVILPYVQFQSKSFNKVLDFFKDTTVYDGELKGVIEYSTVHKDLQYYFGAGGIHASQNGIFESDEENIIIDIDVASYYPNLAIQNRFYPEHLGEEFCDIYLGVYNTRAEAKTKAKKTKDLVAIAINAGLKLGLNGVYGKSNDKYSFFYDPLYTLKTTINGQLLLAMLSEQLSNIAEIIQVNTDGVTIRINRKYEQAVYDICKEWEKLTKLELEYAYYNKMVIKDVNNYLAQTTSGYCKYKGAFEIDKEVAGEPALHKNNSYRIISIALSEYFIKGVPIEKTIRNHDNIYDFCAAVRATEGWHYKLINQRENTYRDLTKTVRYFVSNNPSSYDTGILIKYHDDGRESHVEAHPLKGKYYNCTEFNQYEEEDYNVNYLYYERECRKVINNIQNPQLTLL